MPEGIILRAADVCVGCLAYPCLYRTMKRGEFPRGIKLGVGVVGWKREDVIRVARGAKAASTDRRCMSHDWK